MSSPRQRAMYATRDANRKFRLTFSKCKLNSAPLMQPVLPVRTRKSKRRRRRVHSRRNGKKWSSSLKDSQNFVLKIVPQENPRRGIMKILTLEDSLRSCATCTPKDNDSNDPQRSMTRNPFLRSLVASISTPLEVEYNPVSQWPCLSVAKTVRFDAAIASSESGITAASDEKRCNRGSHEKTNRRGAVTFERIEIREYEIIVGDNPAVPSGVPLSLGWQYSTVSDVPLTVHEYEMTRIPFRRQYREMILTPQEREDVLREKGFSRNKIKKAADAAARAKAKRRKAVQNFNRHGFEEKMGGSLSHRVRWMQRKVRSGRQDSQDALWTMAQSRSLQRSI